MNLMGSCEHGDCESCAFPSVTLELRDWGGLPSPEGAEDQSISSPDTAWGGGGGGCEVKETLDPGVYLQMLGKRIAA